MSLSREEVLDAIAEMSVMDVVQLVEAMEEKFGVSAAAAVAAAPVAAAGGDAAPAEEKDEFDIVLTAAGDKKVTSSRQSAALPASDSEAKEMVDGAPSTLKEAAPKAEAEEAKRLWKKLAQPLSLSNKLELKRDTAPGSWQMSLVPFCALEYCLH